MTTRRQFIAFGALAAPCMVFAQQGKARRIGFLGLNSPSSWEHNMIGFRAGLRDFGYVDGANIVVEYRWAEGSYERLPELAIDLVRSRVEVIVTHGGAAIQAARAATTTIPIVMASFGDAVNAGLIRTLARPGGNMTGLNFFAVELAAKRVELFKESVPSMKRLGVLCNPPDETVASAMEAAAKVLKMTVQRFEVAHPAGIERAVAAMKASRMDAVAITEDPMLAAHKAHIAALATEARLASAGNPDYAKNGFLIGFGADIPALYRRSVYFVDRILKGARPQDLPVERPTKFELVVNRKTAKALGLTIPQPFLMRADRVIE
jgi:ABC-type uncharacterized transport system substrate-binding protein